MTEAERKVIDTLVKAWNAFLQLPVEHPDDLNEFRQGIHVLQDKVLARPARRALNAEIATLRERQRSWAGVVKWFDPEKRCGMIQPTAGGGDVFIQPDVVGDLLLAEGQNVRFTLVFIEGGKAAARNIKPKGK